MKPLILILTALTLAQINEPAKGGKIYDHNRLCDAIYRAEGGADSNFPYGIKSIDTHGDANYARKICLNSIRNAEKRWIKAGKPEDFIVFMGRRFSPPEQNPNWVRLVKHFYYKQVKILR